MATDKTLPDWAVVGAVVLRQGYGGVGHSKRTIDRVTKTSAFIGEDRFVVRAYDREKSYLEAYGRGDMWRTVPTISPLAGVRAQNILRQERREKDERDFQAALNEVIKARKYEPEELRDAIRDLREACIIREAQINEIIAEKAARAEQRRADAEEFARLRAEREEQYGRE